MPFYFGLRLYRGNLVFVNCWSNKYVRFAINGLRETIVVVLTDLMHCSKALSEVCLTLII